MSRDYMTRVVIARALAPWLRPAGDAAAQSVADDVRDHLHAADLLVLERATVVAILGHHAAGLSLSGDVVEPLRRALAKPQRARLA